MTEITIDQAFHKAIEAHKAGNFQVADGLYSFVLNEQPQHPDANHNMGVLAVSIGKVEQSLSFFKTALSANPSIAQFWFSYINAFIELERFEDAQALFNQAKSKGANGDGFDELERKLNERRQCLTERVNVDQGIRKARTNILDTLKLEQAITLAEKRFKEGVINEAKRIYLDILVKFPKNARAIAGIKNLDGGNVVKGSKIKDPPQKQLQALVDLYNRKQLVEALEQAAELSKRYANSSALCNIHGAIYKSLGKLDAAIEAYKKALLINPNYVDAHYNMGNALRDYGKHDEAITAYENALNLQPGHIDAYNNIGNILRNQGKLEKAIIAFKKAIKINPNRANIYYNLGNVLLAKGELILATDAYCNAIAIDPNYAAAYNNKGNALKDLGEFDQALEAFEKGLSIKPDFPGIVENVGYCLLMLGEIERGKSTIRGADGAISL
jgi:tetratricopeptide (TPR) repeat protein